MAIYSTSSINYEYVKVRWQEPYVSNALNRKMFGVLPKGIYSGFVIGAGGLSTRDIQITSGSVSGGLGTGMTGGYVSGNFDESIQYSIALHQTSSGWQTTVSMPPGSMPVHLDATGLDGLRVYIVIDVNYNLNQTTTANFLLVNAAQINSNPSYIVIGYCDVPASPATPLSGSNFGYDDANYPRLTPLATAQKAGFMSASSYNLLTNNFLWQQLCSSQRDPNNNYQITIQPSQAVNSGTNARVYTYIQANVASKFPRSSSGAYNGGSGNNQLTYLNIQTGTISGAHQIAGNLSFSIPSVSGTPSSYQVGIVALDSGDNINVVYGSIYSSFATAVLDDNLPVVGKSLMQICAFVVQTNGAGVIQPLAVNAIYDRRPFLNVGGGAGGGSAGSAQYLSEFENSIYNFSLPTDLTVDGTAYIDTVNSTGSYDLVNSVFTLSSASKTLISTNVLCSEFLSSSTDIADVSVQVSYLTSNVDTGATYQLSRDGGISYQTVSMARIGSSQDYAGRLIFADTDTVSTLSTYVSGNIDSTQPFDSGSNQAIAQVFTTTSAVVPKQATLYVNKVGSAGGTITIQVVKDSSGSPSTLPTDVLTQSSPIAITSLSSGANVVTASLSGAALPAGTYHLVATVDSVYRASWASGVTELQLRTDASSPSISAIKQFNGTTWATVSGEAAPYTLSGRLMDLRLKVTSSSAAKISGFHLMYAPAASVVLPQQQQQTFVFLGDTNPNTFTLTNFQPNALTLKVYEADTGRVFVYPSFSVVGQIVTFPANTFNLPGQYVTLIFDQVAGGVIDQSGVNATNIVTLRSAINDAIVGTSSDLQNGKATHTSIQAAHDFISSGGRILVLPGTYTENVTMSKSVTIEGKGYLSVLNGTLSITGSGNQVLGLKVTGAISTASGANYNRVKGWGSTVTDLGGSNFFEVIVG